MRLIIDTTVLIHLWRLRRSPARLEELRNILNGSVVYLPWMVSFEFARGLFVHGTAEADAQGFLGRFLPLEITQAQVYQAARIAAELQLAGKPIGICDVWIAAAGLQATLPILTSNPRHFEWITGVQALAYSILD